VRRGAGWLLLVGGLSVLGWYGWQLWGTTWQAQREHRAIVSAVTERWADPAEESVDEVAGWPADDVLAVVRVPRFGDDWAVPLLAGTADDVLSSGLGHFTGTAEPGGVGNFAVAGHRVTHGEPFRRLPDLRTGDEVVVETADAVHTYVLDTDGDDLSVPFTRTWVLDDVPTNPAGGVQPPSQETGQQLITLTTCAELFHTDERLVAFGHLVETVAK